MAVPKDAYSGAGDRIRTGDIDLGKVALYQLSYSRPLREILFSNGNNTHVKRYGNVIEGKAFINLQERIAAVLFYFSVGSGSTELQNTSAANGASPVVLLKV